MNELVRATTDRDAAGDDNPLALLHSVFDHRRQNALGQRCVPRVDRVHAERIAATDMDGHQRQRFVIVSRSRGGQSNSGWISCHLQSKKTIRSEKQSAKVGYALRLAIPASRRAKALHLRLGTDAGRQRGFIRNVAKFGGQDGT